MLRGFALATGGALALLFCAQAQGVLLAQDPSGDAKVSVSLVGSIVEAPPPLGDAVDILSAEAAVEDGNLSVTMVVESMELLPVYRFPFDIYWGLNFKTEGSNLTLPPGHWDLYARHQVVYNLGRLGPWSFNLRYLENGTSIFSNVEVPGQGNYNAGRIVWNVPLEAFGASGQNVTASNFTFYSFIVNWIQNDIGIDDSARGLPVVLPLENETADTQREEPPTDSTSPGSGGERFSPGPTALPLAGVLLGLAWSLGGRRRRDS